MSHMACAASGSERGDQFLGSFEVVPSPAWRPGKPYQQTHLITFENTLGGAGFAMKLKDCRNWKGHWYAESHVEEWVSRSPEAIFPGRAVHVLAAQNYAHLGEKIDLLLVDHHEQFHVIELKVERVASNCGVTPDKIWGQMNRYVDFLRMDLPPFLVSFRARYSDFSNQFHGSAHDLSTDLQQVFGKAAFGRLSKPPTFCRTFLTEGYDDDALDFFRARHRPGIAPIRLVYYRFYLHPGTERHSIEFWEVPLASV